MKNHQIKEALSRYDYITKLGAIKYVLNIDRRTNPKNILSVWKELYQD